MNNVKKLCNNTVQYADQLQQNLEGNNFNQWRKTREHSPVTQIICQKNGLSISDYLCDPLFHFESELWQAMEILKRAQC